MIAILARQIQVGNTLLIEGSSLRVIEVEQSKTALIRGAKKTAFAIVIRLSDGRELIVHPEHNLLILAQGTPRLPRNHAGWN